MVGAITGDFLRLCEALTAEDVAYTFNRAADMSVVNLYDGIDAAKLPRLELVSMMLGKGLEAAVRRQPRTGAERPVVALTAELRLPQPTVSHHLSLLRQVRLVSDRRALAACIARSRAELTPAELARIRQPVNHARLTHSQRRGHFGPQNRHRPAPLLLGCGDVVDHRDLGVSHRPLGGVKKQRTLARDKTRSMKVQLRP